MKKTKIKTEMKNYYCQHIDPSDAEVYMYLWAGDSVRFCLCRLCSTVALGTIVSSRIKEAIAARGLKAERPKDVSNGG